MNRIETRRPLILRLGAVRALTGAAPAARPSGTTPLKTQATADAASPGLPHVAEAPRSAIRGHSRLVGLREDKNARDAGREV
jgi:hypothetical protein